MLEKFGKIVVTTAVLIVIAIIMGLLMFFSWHFFDDLPLVLAPQTAEAAPADAGEPPYAMWMDTNSTHWTLHMQGPGNFEVFSVRLIEGALPSSMTETCSPSGVNIWLCETDNFGTAEIVFPKSQACLFAVVTLKAGAPLMLIGDEIIPDCRIGVTWGGVNNVELTLHVFQALPAGEELTLHNPAELGTKVLVADLACENLDGTTWRCPSGAPGTYKFVFSHQGERSQVVALRRGEDYWRWRYPTGLLNVQWLPFLQTQ